MIAVTLWDVPNFIEAMEFANSLPSFLYHEGVDYGGLNHPLGNYVMTFRFDDEQEAFLFQLKYS